MPATHLLISCAKDEGPFLLEWVAHCPSLGFTRVIAASSDRSDGSDLLLAALGRLGAISHAHAPAPGEAPQHAGCAAIRAAPPRTVRTPASAAPTGS